mmetsp:Transcript_7402/g.14693  ORF Transcript_7402/g.14693 Transcript_7402/m.14693 type:complete len:307 (-) Transcript_7402:27-947(-)|eukprot:CAMPEP_0181292762 /NCGR_PEP_ID=MMETSP1101-20121128/2691_1 /TAXON_ID=46948 /ORGANISM="Rhodomonas abbreviata, Strain Caron Lab Isolate" /LENGTH=306 /DNA_ID=CAMNT_0023397277 /DNA_START=76 /DNA_END=996 /DNA_ORIENTATION=-
MKRPVGKKDAPQGVSISGTKSERPNSGGSIIRTIWVWLNIVIWTILTGIPAMLCMLLIPFLGLSGAQRCTWRCSVVFFRLVLWSSACPYSVMGLENLDPNGNYFFAGNHESLWDVPLIFAILPFWLISVAKKSLRMVPIFGWAVAAGGTVWIDRKNSERARQSMDAAEKSLRSRPRSVLVFPEGTRTPDGELQEFKKGVLILAIQSGIPVVPMCVCGTYQVVVKGSKRIHPRPLRLMIGKPIETKDMTYDDRDTLSQQVYEQIAKMKAEWKASSLESDNKHVESFFHCFVPTAPADSKFWGRLPPP